LPYIPIMGDGAGDLRAILAQNIKKARKDLNVTQSRLAEYAGVSLACIVDIESRRSWVSDRTLASIAQALNREAWQLLLPDAAAAPAPGRETEIQRRVMALVSEKRDEMQGIMDRLTRDILRVYAE